MQPTLLPGDHIIVDKTIMGARIYKNLNFSDESYELLSWRTAGTRGVRRNDVVVFNFPKHEDHIKFVINHVYCKRCVALPGDTFYISGGYFRNDHFNGIVGYKPAQDILATMPDSAVRQQYAWSIFPFLEQLGWTIKDAGPIYLPRCGDIVHLSAKEGALYALLLEYETGTAVEVDWEHNRVICGGVPLEYYEFQHSYYYMCGDNVLDSYDSRYWGFVPEEYIVGVCRIISYSRDRHTHKYNWGRLWKVIE